VVVLVVVVVVAGSCKICTAVLVPHCQILYRVQSEAALCRSVNNTCEGL